MQNENHKKSLALVMALCLAIGLMIPTVSAAGVGTNEDPYVLENGVATEITIAACETAYVYVDATVNPVNLNVSGNRQYYDYTVKVGRAYPQSPNMLANVEVLGIVGGAGLAEIANVGEGEIVLTVTVVETPVGSEYNPDDANAKAFLGGYLLNTDLAEGDFDGYFYLLNVEQSGYLVIENSAVLADGSNTGAYQLAVGDEYGNVYAAWGNVFSNPVIAPVEASQHVAIGMGSDNGEAMTVRAYAYIVAGTEEAPISVKSLGFMAPVFSGETVWYLDGTNGGLYSGKTLVISGYEEGMTGTSVTFNGKTYTANDEGKIRVELPGDENSMLAVHHSFAITNNYEYAMAYTVEVIETVAAENVCTCGAALTYVPEAPACHANGMKEYWYCAECDVFYADAEAKTVVAYKSLTIPATMELTHVEAAPACHVPGTAEYWYCAECEAVFADAEGKILTNRKNLTIAPDCELVHMEAVEACHNKGTLEYWFCPECDAVFADAEGKQLTNRMNLSIPAVEGALKHFEAVAPTKTQDGVKEHWYCEGCDCYFADAEGKYNVAYKSLIVPAIETPATGDSIMVWVVMAVVSVMGMACAVVLNKKKYNA